MSSVRFRYYKHFIISSIGRAKDNKRALYIKFFGLKKYINKPKNLLIIEEIKEVCIWLMDIYTV